MERVFIGLVVLFGVGFLPAEGLDSLKTDLLERQRIFYASDDLWIPPSLPSDKECVGMGCCLMPVGGFLIIREALKKEERSESSKLQDTLVFDKRVGFGLEYSLGLAGTGVGYLKGGMEIIDFKEVFYWVNHINVRGIYRFTTSWDCIFGVGYIWGEMAGRLSVFVPLSNGETPHFCSNADWKISAIIPSLLLKKKWGGKYDRFLEFGLEYYFATGINYEKKAYTLSPVTITTWGQSVGAILSLGFEKSLSNKVKWHLTCLARVGWIKNPQYTATEEVVRDATFSLNFTGIYLKMGMDYLFLRTF